MFGSNDFASIDVPAGNRFLNYLSSNFNGTDKIGITKGTYDPGDTFLGVGSGTGWKIEKNAERTASNYYLKAGSDSELSGVFQNIIQEISTLDIVADTNTILSDTLSEYFALNVPEDTDAAKAITAEKWGCTGKDANGNYTWKKADTQPTTTIEITGKTIKITGFDYTKNAVTATTKEGGTTYSGAKLVVTIRIQPDAACTAWQAGEHAYPTNSTATNSKAGLSGYTDKDGTAVDPTLLDQSPEANVTAYSVSYNWNMPEGVTAPSIGLPAIRYYIKGQGYTVNNDTYPDVLSDNGSTLCHFVGWTLGNTENVRGTNQTMGEQDVKLYAMWNPEAAYTVVFDANGGSWQTAPEGYTMGERSKTAAKAGLVAGTKVTAPAAPENGSKVFKGWGFTKNAAEKDAVSGLDGEGTDIKTLREKANVQNDTVTLYAIWGEAGTEPKQEATVTFKIVGGTWSDGTDTDITVPVKLNDNGEGTLTYIPSGMKAKSGYESTGTWDKEIVKTVTENVVYTYTFSKKELEPSGDQSRSKTATQLDTNTWTSNVTLSLPSAQEELSSDIVFVLDKSSCKKETAASAEQMLTALQS